MAKRRDLARYLKVYILRTAQVSYDDTAGLLGCGTHMVGEAEQWIQSGATYARARGLVEDGRIQRLVDRDLSGLGLRDEERSRVSRVTADDILVHYGRFPSDDERSAGIPGPAMEEHRHRLRGLATDLSNQLALPPVASFFSPEMCRTAISLRRRRRARLPAGQWCHPFGPWCGVRQVAGQPDRLEVKLGLEEAPLWPGLLRHLEIEMPEIGARLKGWKSGLGPLLGDSLRQLDDLVAECPRSTRMNYVGAGTRTGLFDTAPAYAARFALGDAGKGRLCLNVEPAAPDTWRVFPSDFPAWGLAQGGEQRMRRARGSLTEWIRTVRRRGAWRRAAARHAELDETGRALRVFLDGVIERGDFLGTCHLCPDRSTGGSH